MHFVSSYVQYIINNITRIITIIIIVVAHVMGYGIIIETVVVQWPIVSINIRGCNYVKRNHIGHQLIINPGRISYLKRNHLP